MHLAYNDQEKQLHRIWLRQQSSFIWRKKSRRSGVMKQDYCKKESYKWKT